MSTCKLSHSESGVKQCKGPKCKGSFTVFVGALEKLSNTAKQAKTVLFYLYLEQLAESMSPCVETAPERPANSLCALSKSYQMLRTTPGARGSCQTGYSHSNYLII